MLRGAIGERGQEFVESRWHDHCSLPTCRAAEFHGHLDLIDEYSAALTVDEVSFEGCKIAFGEGVVEIFGNKFDRVRTEDL